MMGDLGFASSSEKDIFLFIKTFRRGSPSLIYIGYRVSFPGVKRQGSEVHHYPLTSAE
jgi:hypothetical protein